MIDVIEFKLEDSLAKVETLIYKNVMGVKQCKTQVNKLQKMVKSPLVTGSVNLSEQDVLFFRRMIAGPAKKVKDGAVNTPKLTRDQVQEYKKIQNVQQRTNSSKGFIPALQIPKPNYEESTHRKIIGEGYSIQTKSSQNQFQMTSTGRIASETQRVVEEGPETTRQRHYKIQSHQRSHYGGFVFSDVKNSNMVNNEGDSDTEDIQQQIATIDQAESDYNSEKMMLRRIEEVPPIDKVKYLDLKTQPVRLGLSQNKVVDLDSLNRTESDKILIEQEHQIRFKGTSTDQSENNEILLNEVYFNDTKTNNQTSSNNFKRNPTNPQQT